MPRSAHSRLTVRPFRRSWDAQAVMVSDAPAGKETALPSVSGSAASRTRQLPKETVSPGEMGCAAGMGGVLPKRRHAPSRYTVTP